MSSVRRTGSKWSACPPLGAGSPSSSRRDHGVPRVALADTEAADAARGAWKGGVLAGEQGIHELIATSGADLVLNAMVGSAGLGPTIVALTEGIDLALANKESLVAGGELVTALAEATDTRIIPVDSEHSALHQLVRGDRQHRAPRAHRVRRPFRGQTDLSEVTREEALAHPTWDMGGKITIDSATLINKGLELIEAHHLFGTPYDRIDVLVHPQSIVHAIVHLNDGGSLAHRLPGHARPDLLRAPLSGSRRRRCPDARPRRAGRADLRASRSGRVPVSAAGARGR